MQTLETSSFRRRILVADALASGATGLLMAFGAGTLQDLLGLPGELLRGAGWSLLPFAALLALLSRHGTLPRAAVVAVIAVNAAWVAGSFLLLVAGGLAPSALGYAFVVGQALTVALLAEMEYVGLGKSPVLAG
jgi:hypothetical protein